MATMQQVIDGLKVLRKYGNGHVAAEHDILMAGPDLKRDDVDADDRAELERAGWFWSEEFDCWARFV